MAQVIVIGKKKYAVGLSWGPLDPEKPLRPQAIEKARQSKNGLYAIFGEIEPMVGHCDPLGGVKAGMPVLAPLVAEIWPANTLLAVSTGGAMLGFQILNGLVYDDVCGDPEEVRTWFDGLVGEHKWDHVSSPWDGGSSSVESFEDSVRTGGVKAPRLHSVNEGRSKAVKVLVLLLLVLAGFLFVSKVVRDRREMSSRLAMLSRHVIVRVTPPVVIVPPGAFVAACLPVLNRLPSDAAGWTVKNLTCKPSIVRILWKRSAGSGTIRDLESRLGTRVRIRENSVVETVRPLSVPTISRPVQSLPSLSEERKDLASVLEYYSLDYQSENNSFLPGLSGSGGDGFSVELPDIPEGGLLSALSAIPGLSVRSLEWTGQSQWILKGELKHAPIVLVHHHPGNVISDPSQYGSGGKPAGSISSSVHQPVSHSGPGEKPEPGGVGNNEVPLSFR